MSVESVVLQKPGAAAISPQPLVSVIIPAYNAERTIRQAVESVLKQTMQQFEIIVVDDSSKDQTARQLDGIDARVRVVTQPNSGPSAARNHGARLAKGDYLAFLDADDAWLPEKLERQLAVFHSDASLGAVQCGAFYADSDLNILEEKRCEISGDPLWDSVTFRNLPAFPQSVMYTRLAWLGVGPYDTTLTGLEDWEMAIRTAWKCKLGNIAEPLVMRRLHEGCRSNSVDINVKPGKAILDRFFMNPQFPETLRRKQQRAYGAFYTSLAGGYFQHKRWQPYFYWMLKALWTDPGQLKYMVSWPLRLWQRAVIRQGKGK